MIRRQQQYNQHKHNFPEIQLHPSISKKQIQKLSQSYQFDSHFFTLILYNYLETPKLQDFLSISLQAEGQLCLMKRQIKANDKRLIKQQDKQFEYFLLYMVNENTPLMIQSKNERTGTGSEYSQLKELKPILTTLISLCDKIVVFDLDKEKQAFIQKIFFDSVTTCQKIKWQNTCTRVHRLVFIRDCYNEQKMKRGKSQSKLQKQKFPNISSNITASTSMDTLQYYSSLKQYDQHLQKQQQKYLYYKEQFKLVNDNHFIDNLIKEKRVVKKISLKQILHIYQKIMELITRPIQQVVLQSLLIQFLGQKGSQKNVNIQFQNKQMGKINLNQPWKVRYYIQKVYQLQSIANLYSTLEKQIFYPNVSLFSVSHVQKQLRKYLSASPNSRFNNLVFNHVNFSHFQYIPSFITQVSLSINSRQKLLWKLNRLQKFQRQLVQQEKISPLNSSDKIFYELRDQQISYWLQKYYKKWTQKSLSHLKTYFNKIANQKDHKAIQQFKQQCYKMQQRMSKIDPKLYEKQKKEMVFLIQQQLNSFVQYHNDVIEMKRFSGIRYFWKQIGYMLKHKQNVRNKIILFVLMIILSLMQKNVIAGLTIGTMAVIVLAIRI